MWDQRVINIISFVLVIFVCTRYAIAKCMAKMHSCVPKPHTCQRRCKKHLFLGFVVVWIFDSTREVFDGHLQRFERKYVTDWVCALIYWSKNWVRWPWDTFVIWDGSPRFK
jgi:hypothetical protein